MSLISRVVLTTLLLLLAACGNDNASVTRPLFNFPGSTPVAAAPDYWPTAGWQSAPPEAHGFAPGAFDTLAADAATALPYYTSLLVIKDGWIVHESYHPTATESSDADTRHHVWSITKSVTAMTLGRAWTRGDLGNLDVSAGSVFPAEAFGGLAADDARRDITLRNALQMRSGLAWNENAWLLTSRDPLLQALLGSVPGCAAGGELILCSILQRPLAYTPGSVWNYDTYDTYLVSAFFRNITGWNLNDYASQYLFSDLGITFTSGADWPNLGTYTFGGGLLYIRSRDLARLGLLMQYDGRWDGTQLISKEWMDMSLASQVSGQVAGFDGAGEPAASVGSDIPYGLQWWRRTGPGMGGLDSITARGLGGQMMQIFRDKGIIILITCDTTASFGDRSADINSFLQSRILARYLH